MAAVSRFVEESLPEQSQLNWQCFIVYDWVTVDREVFNRDIDGGREFVKGHAGFSSVAVDATRHIVSHFVQAAPRHRYQVIDCEILGFECPVAVLTPEGIPGVHVVPNCFRDSPAPDPTLVRET